MNDQEPAVVVKDLYKSFKLPHEQHSGIKQLIVNFAKRKKGYEVQHVLDDVSFEIKKGEFFGIVGRNGSGKSTLLKLLAGIYVPDKGEIGINGSLTPFIELGVGFNPELTGRENVYMNGAMLGFSNKEMDNKYDEIVAFSELPRFMDQKLKNYSSGMQVRLAFAIAIQADTDILLLDEVLAVGDAAFQQKCFNYFNKLRENKKTVILVTHDMSSVERFCTRALVLEKGKVKLIGSSNEIADEYRRENIPGNEIVEGNLSKKRTLLKTTIKEKDATIDICFDIDGVKNVSDYYVGMTIFKNDSNIAEINNYDTPTYGQLVYQLDVTSLNPGAYEVSAALFDRKNRSLMAITDRSKFLIPGHDETRGGGMKLQPSWINKKI